LDVTEHLGLTTMPPTPGSVESLGASASGLRNQPTHSGLRLRQSPPLVFAGR